MQNPWNGGPGNKADRTRFAALSEQAQAEASALAEHLYDGSRSVARCWSEALDDAHRSLSGLAAVDHLSRAHGVFDGYTEEAKTRHRERHSA